MFCRANGIQHIVNVGTGIENKFPDKISYTTVELLDLPEQNLQPGAMLNNFSNLISYTSVELLDLPEQNLQPGAMLNNFSNLISYTTVGTPGSPGTESPTRCHVKQFF